MKKIIVYGVGFLALASSQIACSDNRVTEYSYSNLPLKAPVEAKHFEENNDPLIKHINEYHMLRAGTINAFNGSISDLVFDRDDVSIIKEMSYKVHDKRNIVNSILKQFPPSERQKYIDMMQEPREYKAFDTIFNPDYSVDAKKLQEKLGSQGNRTYVNF
jgi:hypothetical protein